MRRPVARVAWPIFLLVLGLAVAQAPSPEPLPTEMTEHVEVLLVQVPFIATDRHGRPITDLKLEEIEIEVDGRRINPDYLDRRRERSAETAPMKPVRIHVDIPGGWPLPITSPEQEVEYLVFLLDVQNDERIGREQALDQLLEFARNDLHPAVQAAVFSFDGQLHLEVPFTADRNALIAAMKQGWSRSPRARMNLESRIRNLLTQMDECEIPGGTGAIKNADTQCLRDVARSYVEETRSFAEGYFDSLHYLVSFLGGLDGRASVYAISHGVEADPTPVVTEAARSVFGNAVAVAGLHTYLGFGSRPEVRMNEVQRLAVQNDVTLHFIDRTRAPTSDFGAKNARLNYAGTFPAGTAYRAAQADLEQIATTTGGVFRSKTDLGDGLREVETAQEGLYEVGYRMDRTETGELSAPRLSTTRRGVKLTYGSGVASPPTGDTPPASGRITLRPMDREPGPDTVGLPHGFVIEIEPRQLGYQEGREEATADFTLHVIVEDESGRRRVGSYHLINHAYPLDLWRSGKVAPLTMHGWVELPPGAYALKAIVRSIRTGWTGEIATAITVIDS